MSKSLLEMREEAVKKYGTVDNKYTDFPVGTPVKIITPSRDFHFFYGETGKVIKSEEGYLNIIVEFDSPRVFKQGEPQKTFNFKPEDLLKLEPSSAPDFSSVTRFEIIDNTACKACEGTGRITIEGPFHNLECPACHGAMSLGREVIFHNDNKTIELSLQDDGRTLKVFINKREKC